MSKKSLLETIKKNNEEFTFYFNCEETISNNENIDALSYLQKSRIREIEALIEMLKKKEKTWGGYDGEEIVDDKQSWKYNEALNDIIKILQEAKEAIKKLNK